MYLSKIQLRRNISIKELAILDKTDGYRLHKLVWRLFSDDSERKRDYLYRHEAVNGWPIFYTVSKRPPEDRSGLWEIDMKPYEPKLAKQDRLAFMLRANPVRIAKQERTDNEVKAWLKSRVARELPIKEATKKRIRHDVIMEEKTRIGFKHLSQDQRPDVATLVQETGVSWLKEKGDENGFHIDDDSVNPSVRADGYCQHRLYKRKGKKLVEFSTLDFNGILSVTDAATFVEKCLFKGLGSAKGFGCGLMLVKRI